MLLIGEEKCWHNWITKERHHSLWGGKKKGYSGVNMFFEFKTGDRVFSLRVLKCFSKITEILMIVKHSSSEHTNE